MATPGGCGDGLELRDVAVRPVRDAAERRRWDALISQFHYLPYNGLFGQSLRHVAECGGRWVALRLRGGRLRRGDYNGPPRHPGVRAAEMAPPQDDAGPVPYDQESEP